MTAGMTSAMQMIFLSFFRIRLLFDRPDACSRAFLLPSDGKPGAGNPVLRRGGGGLGVAGEPPTSEAAQGPTSRSRSRPRPRVTQDPIDTAARLQDPRRRVLDSHGREGVTSALHFMPGRSRRAPPSGHRRPGSHALLEAARVGPLVRDLDGHVPEGVQTIRLPRPAPPHVASRSDGYPPSPSPPPPVARPPCTRRRSSSSRSALSCDSGSDGATLMRQERCSPAQARLRPAPPSPPNAGVGRGKETPPP